jgi:rhamnosyltransferase subunit B
VSARAACRLGCRAILLVGDSGAVLPASDGIIVRAYAPYSALFPCARLIVHHGGIGTTAQALRAGRPQLIVPIFADQPDNAARAARLGVARVLRRSRYRESALVAALRAAEIPTMIERARTVSAQIALEDGAARAAQAIVRRLRRT